MDKIIFTFFVLTLLIPQHVNAANESVDLSQVLLKPYILENNDTECENILEDVNKTFLSNNDFYSTYISQMTSKPRLLDWQYLGSDELTKLQAYNKEFYLHNYSRNGCGGACSTNQSLVSTKPFPSSLDYSSLRDYLGELAKDTHPPASYSYAIFKNKQEIPYLFIVGTLYIYKRKIFIYKLKENAKW